MKPINFIFLYKSESVSTDGTYRNVNSVEKISKYCNGPQL